MPPEEQLSIAELNPDGYIECFEDLDCPDPVEVPENKTISSFSCSGEIKSQLCLHQLCSGEIQSQILKINCAQGKSVFSQLRKRYEFTIPPGNTKSARRRSGETLS